MKNYTVRTSCEVAGRWREGGETVAMTAEQAKYLVAPLGNVLIDPDAVAPVAEEASSGQAPVEASADAPVAPAQPSSAELAELASEADAESSRRGRLSRA